ncbi:MAG: sulfur carrier protein ThiS [Alphaproteobacteria bacterium]|nr:sulfur carrier protein ThiS [Alphaproteobacteria bacterium]
MDAIALTINGEPRTVPAGCTVAALLAELGMDREGVAVAVDMRVVPRSQHAARTLQDGDKVEVIIAVGGG